MTRLPTPGTAHGTDGAPAAGARAATLTGRPSAAVRPSPGRAAAREALVDAGLLSPVRAGTPVEAAVSDMAWLQAMLDAEAALARAQARLGT
ncbi:3-carboxy-cis,cis-muconate cycloisomerase, partial [Streptomyces sp. NPDC059015]